MPDDDDEGAERRRALFAVSDGVLGAAVLLAAGVYGGAWLDTRLHTAPWLSVGLSILGGGLGLARMVAKANALDTKRAKPKLKAKNAEQSAGSQAAPGSSDGKKQRMPYDDFDEQN